MLQFPEMQGYMKKNIIFSKKQIFQKKTEFLKEGGIFAEKKTFFFLHFQILSHKTKLKGNCNFSLGIYFWQENQMLKDIFLKKNLVSSFHSPYLLL